MLTLTTQHVASARVSVQGTHRCRETLTHAKACTNDQSILAIEQAILPAGQSNVSMEFAAASVCAQRPGVSAIWPPWHVIPGSVQSAQAVLPFCSVNVCVPQGKQGSPSGEYLPADHSQQWRGAATDIPGVHCTQFSAWLSW